MEITFKKQLFVAMSLGPEGKVEACLSFRALGDYPDLF